MSPRTVWTRTRTVPGRGDASGSGPRARRARARASTGAKLSRRRRRVKAPGEPRHIRLQAGVARGILAAMSIKSDRWIRRMAREHHMIEPFTDKQVREGVISYGLSSYGYDMRVADEFRIFTNVNSTIVDPKRFDPQSFVELQGGVCIFPPYSFALARSVAYCRVARSV